MIQILVKYGIYTTQLYKNCNKPLTKRIPIIHIHIHTTYRYSGMPQELSLPHFIFSSRLEWTGNLGGCLGNDREFMKLLQRERSRTTQDYVKILLEPLSLLVLEGPSRLNFTHAIRQSYLGDFFQAVSSCFFFWCKRECHGKLRFGA